MFDGKMTGILSGAGGAHCQLCTDTFTEILDLQLICSCFPINRSISVAKEIFSTKEKEDFYLLHQMINSY